MTLSPTPPRRRRRGNPFLPRSGRGRSHHVGEIQGILENPEFPQLGSERCEAGWGQAADALATVWVAGDETPSDQFTPRVREQTFGHLRVALEDECVGCGGITR